MKNFNKIYKIEIKHKNSEKIYCFITKDKIAAGDTVACYTWKGIAIGTAISVALATKEEIEKHSECFSINKNINFLNFEETTGRRKISVETALNNPKRNLEEAAKKLLLHEKADAIGFYETQKWDEESQLWRSILVPTSKQEEIEFIIAIDSITAFIAAIKCCEAQNIEPNFNGGIGEYPHISHGSIRSYEGFTMGCAI